MFSQLKDFLPLKVDHRDLDASFAFRKTISCHNMEQSNAIVDERGAKLWSVPMDVTCTSCPEGLGTINLTVMKPIEFIVSSSDTETFLKP
jgi:hypothetical protein